MSYLDAGYNEFISREILGDTAIGSLEIDESATELSASRLTGGVMQSSRKTLRIDLENDFFVVTDGAEERVRLGVLGDGSIGLLIKDNAGNVLMQISGDTNIIQSPDKSLEVNFNNTQILVRNEGGTPVVAIGKLA